MTALETEVVVAEVRVSTNIEEPVRLKLSDRPSTFCSRASTFTLKIRRSIQLRTFKIVFKTKNPLITGMIFVINDSVKQK